MRLSGRLSKRKPKKPDIVKAAETVQGFIGFQRFSIDIIKMLGDGVYYVKSEVYAKILKLITECATIKISSLMDP